MLKNIQINCKNVLNRVFSQSDKSEVTLG